MKLSDVPFPPKQARLNPRAVVPSNDATEPLWTLETPLEWDVYGSPPWPIVNTLLPAPIDFTSPIWSLNSPNRIKDFALFFMKRTTGAPGKIYFGLIGGGGVGGGYPWQIGGECCSDDIPETNLMAVPSSQDARYAARFESMCHAAGQAQPIIPDGLQTFDVSYRTVGNFDAANHIELAIYAMWRKIPW